MGFILGWGRLIPLGGNQIRISPAFAEAAMRRQVLRISDFQLLRMVQRSCRLRFYRSTIWLLIPLEFSSAWFFSAPSLVMKAPL